MKQIFIIILLIATTFSNTDAHPVHISVVNLDITAEGKIIFSIKFFTDDLEQVINSQNADKISFSKNMKLSSVEKYILAYIADNFRIKTNLVDYVSAYSLKKMTMSEDAIWFFFEVENKKHNFDNLLVENSLMCDFFQDQTNLFIISTKGKEEAYRFNNINQKNSFVFRE